jgi:paired amphipathic helix protein Sin3a
MLIENNSAAIRMLEPLVALAVGLPQDRPKVVPLSPQFDILHIRAIARAYGDHGYEIIDLLKRSPAAAAPIILPRLRQKDEEWRRLKIEMKNQWRKIGDQNYTRSLDHRSFYFKQEDKKRCTTRSLMGELREAHERAFREAEPEDGPPLSTHSSMVATHHQGSARHHHQHNTIPLLSTYSLRYTYEDGSIIHQQIFDAISRVASAHLSESQQAELFAWWNAFMHHIFNCRDMRAPTPVAPRGNVPRHSRRVGRRAAAAAAAHGGGDKDDDENDGDAHDDDDVLAQAAHAAAEKKQKKKAAAAAKKRKAAKGGGNDDDDSTAAMDSDDDGATSSKRNGNSARRGGGAAGAGTGAARGARNQSRKGKDDKDDEEDDDEDDG